MKQATKQYLIDLMNEQINEEENNDSFGGRSESQSEAFEKTKEENVAEMTAMLKDLKQTTCSDKGFFMSLLPNKTVSDTRVMFMLMVVLLTKPIKLNYLMKKPQTTLLPIHLTI